MPMHVAGQDFYYRRQAYIGPSGFHDRGKRTEFPELPHENGILSNQTEFAESAIF